jgi:membrane protease YdiL (CAAX protease family)
MPDEVWLTLAIVVVGSLLVLSGWRGVPGLGAIGSIAVIGWLVWYDGTGLAVLGFKAPSHPAWTVGIGVIVGTVIQVLSIMVLEPLSDRITRSPHDHSIVEGIRHSWLTLAQWLLVVWLLVAPVEEIIFRGFLLKQLSVVLPGGVATAVALVVSSVVFGLSHLYQGRSGALSTALVGSFLGMLFIWSGYSLWLPIITHGVIDTVGLVLIATDRESHLTRLGLRGLPST